MPASHRYFRERLPGVSPRRKSPEKDGTFYSRRRATSHAAVVSGFSVCIIEARGQVSGFDAVAPIWLGFRPRDALRYSWWSAVRGPSPMVFGTAGEMNETIVADKCAAIALSMHVWSHGCVQGAYIVRGIGSGMVYDWKRLSVRNISEEFEMVRTLVHSMKYNYYRIILETSL